MTPAKQSVLRQAIGIWVLIASVLLASFEATADRFHAHADPAPAELVALDAMEEGNGPADQSHADCPHCFHLSGLNAQCEPASSGKIFPADAFDPPPAADAGPTWHQAPPIRPPITG